MAGTVYINDLNSGYEVGHAREALLYILHTIKLFRKYWKTAQMFVAQLVNSLEDCDINLEATPADAIPLRQFTHIGDDLDALGPLFSKDTLLHEQKAHQQVMENQSFEVPGSCLLPTVQF